MRERPPEPPSFPIGGALAVAAFIAALAWSLADARPWPRKPWLASLLVLLGTVAAIAFRRPSQVLAPYLWVEEGKVTLPQFLESGLGFLVEPVAGYIILPSKLLFYAATFAPTALFPHALFALSVGFTWLVCTIIAVSPTHLRHPLPLALLVLVLPINSEVYGTAHYAFWIGSLLLLPLMFWDNERGVHRPARMVMVALAGLSSPLVIALLPALFARLAVYRARDELPVLAVGAATAATQAMVIATSATHVDPPMLLQDPTAVLAKFIGRFAVPGDAYPAIAGAAIALLAAAVVAHHGSRRAPWLWIAAYGFAASVAISVARVPIHLLDPESAGPRYFFYPYVFLGILLLEAVRLRAWWATAASTVLALALWRFIEIAPRTHEPINWMGQLRACAESGGGYQFPIHYEGDAGFVMIARLDASSCRRILDGWAEARSD